VCVKNEERGLAAKKHKMHKKEKQKSNSEISERMMN
jgi:hypothetical protein